MARVDATVAQAVVNGKVEGVFVPADPVNMEAVTLTGKELIVATNTGVSAWTVTITSVPDRKLGRTGDVTQSIEPGDTWIFGPFDTDGFQQTTDRKLYFQAAHADVEFLVIRLP